MKILIRFCVNLPVSVSVLFSVLGSVNTPLFSTNIQALLYVLRYVTPLFDGEKI